MARLVLWGWGSRATAAAWGLVVVMMQGPAMRSRCLTMCRLPVHNCKPRCVYVGVGVYVGEERGLWVGFLCAPGYLPPPLQGRALLAATTWLANVSSLSPSSCRS